MRTLMDEIAFILKIQLSCSSNLPQEFRWKSWVLTQSLKNTFKQLNIKNITD